MLSEISRHKRINIVWFHLYEVLRLGKYIETESRTVVARGWGRRNRKLFSGYRVLVPKMEKFRMWMVVMVSQQCEWPSCHAIGPYNWGVVKMVSFMLCIATVKQKQKKNLTWEYLTVTTKQSRALLMVFMLCLVSHVWFFMTLWTVAHQAPLSMGILQVRVWSGLPCSPPGDLPNLGIEPRSPALQLDSLPSEPDGFYRASQRSLETGFTLQILFQWDNYS